MRIQICAEMSNYEHFCHVLQLPNPNWKISLFYTGVISLDEHIKFHLLSCNFAVHLQNSENMLMCDSS